MTQRLNYYVSLKGDNYDINRASIVKIVKDLPKCGLLSIDTDGNSINFGDILSSLTYAFDLKFIYINGLNSKYGNLCINIIRGFNEEYLCFIGPAITLTNKEIDKELENMYKNGTEKFKYIS